METRGSKAQFRCVLGCCLLVGLAAWILSGAPFPGRSGSAPEWDRIANLLSEIPEETDRVHEQAPTVALNKAGPPFVADLTVPTAISSFIDSNVEFPPPTADETIAEFRDPFYAFVVGIVEGDSLGVWTEHHLQSFLARCPRQSKLPLEYFQSMERKAVDSGTSEYRRGVRVQRVWRLTLKEPLHYPMPYNILGYNLGSLSIARVLTFSEWRLGDRNVHAPQDGAIAVVSVTGLTVFRLDSGWIVMDVHGWLDKLLGGSLDDSWTQGFAICRRDGQIHGLALSLNRDLRPLCGEIDFATNEVTTQGGPLTRGVAVYVRPWVTPIDDTSSRVWQFNQ